MLVIGNLLRYMFAKNDQNRAWSDKVIAKIKWCSFCRAVCMHVTRFSHEKAVRLSVRPSVKHVICGKTKETCAHILISHEISFILVVWKEECVVRATFFAWKFGSDWPGRSEKADFQLIFARSASAVTPSKKSSINTNRKSTTLFQ